MRVIWKNVLLIVFCVLLLAKPVSAAEIIMSQPVVHPCVTISNGKINKKQVKSGDTLKYQFTITDEGISETEDAGYFGLEDKGIYYPMDCYVCVTWKSSKNQEIERTYKWKRWNKKKLSMTISDKIRIMDGMQPGEWKISEIQIVDGLGEDANGGLIRIYDSQDVREYADCYADLSFATFTVKKKKGTRVDKKAPAFDLKSLKVSKTSVKTKEKSTFSVKVKDESKIECVTAAWRTYSKVDGQVFDPLNDYNMKYSKKKKCYQCSLTLASKKDERMELECLYVRDIYGNEAYYTISDVKGKEKYGKAFSKMTIYRK